MRRRQKATKELAAQVLSYGAILAMFLMIAWPWCVTAVQFTLAQIRGLP